MKKALITLGTITGILFIVWVAMFVCWAIMSPEMAQSVGFVETHLDGLSAALTISDVVVISSASVYASIGIDWHTLSFIVYAILAIVVVLALAFIISCCLNKRKRCIPLVLLILLAGLPLAELVVNYPVTNIMNNNGLTMSYERLISSFDDGVIRTVSVIILAAAAVLAFVFMVIFFITAVVSMHKYHKAVKAEELAYETPDGSEFTTDGGNHQLEAEYVPEPEPTLEVEEELVEPTAVSEDAVEETEPAEEPEPVEEEEAPCDDDVITKHDLLEFIRDIVRDEIAHAANNNSSESHTNSHNVTGANISSPLIVQYFNGVTPAEAPKPHEEECHHPHHPHHPHITVHHIHHNAQPKEEKVEPAPAPAPVVEEKVEPVAEPVPEPAPVVAPAPSPVVEAPKPEKPVIIRIPFQERLLDSEEDVLQNYNVLKNELLSWGLKSRVSVNGDTFRLHRKTYCKMIVAGKGLKLYLALDPADYADSKIPFGDASSKNLYADIPFVFKVKSGLSVRRAKDLIRDVCEKDGLTQEEVGEVDWVKEIKMELKQAKKK